MGSIDPCGARHHVVDLGVDPHRKRGSRICHEVDPEDLGREERHDRDRWIGGVDEIDDAGEQNAEEDGGDFAHVGAQQVAHELLDVVEDYAALADGADYRRVVVVAQNHAARLLSDLRAGDPHRDPDVSGLERRGVVHAVGHHGDRLAVGLQRVDDAQLMFGRDAGVDGDVLRPLGELVVTERLNLVAQRRWLDPRSAGRP